MPVWLAVLMSLASGIIATIVTLIVQHFSEKKRVKKDLLLMLASYRDCACDDVELKRCINKIQIVFYEDEDVINKYFAFVEKINNGSIEKNQTIIIDEYVALLESVAKVVGYKRFDWQCIKKKYTSPDLHNFEIEESNSVNSSSNGLSKKKTSNKDMATTQKGEKR